MTEAEAKAKWCPFYRVAIAVSAADDREIIDNRNDDPMTGPKCIGSACMAWRWRNGAHPMPDDPPSISERYEGFCGLAGKP